MDLKFRAEAKKGLLLQSEIEVIEDYQYLHKIKTQNTDRVLALAKSMWTKN